MPGEDTNGRIERKLDQLHKSVNGLQVDMATMVERTKQMQAAQVTAAKTRASTCPMTSVIAQYGARVDGLGEDISEDRRDIGELKGCTGEMKKTVTSHESSLKANGKLLAGLITVVALVGGVFGILAGVGVI